MSELDKNFDSIVEQINSQLQEAAQALAKANQIAQDAGMGSISSSGSDSDYDRFMHAKYGRDYYNPESKWSQEKQEEAQRAWETHLELVSQIEFTPVIRELAKAGWSTSSMYC